MNIACAPLEEEQPVPTVEEINESNNTIEEIVEMNDTLLPEWLIDFPTDTDMEKVEIEWKYPIFTPPLNDYQEIEEEYHGQDHEYWD